jgi:heme O synthase-like polyprenyltransferase
MSSNTDTVILSGTSTLRRAGDFVELAKPRVVLMVLITTFVGFYLGSEQVPQYLILLQTLIGTALAAGGTLALNQYMERDSDAVMRSAAAGRSFATARSDLVRDRRHDIGARLSGTSGESHERVRDGVYHDQLFVILHAA